MGQYKNRINQAWSVEIKIFIQNYKNDQNENNPELWSVKIKILIYSYRKGQNENNPEF